MLCYENQEMKCITRTLLLPAAAAALAALPLAGCQQARQEGKKEPATEQVSAKADSTKEDNMVAFYERMRRYKALYPDVPLDK